MKRIPLTVFWVLAVTVICSAQTTFYYPHVANGVLGSNIWRTTIFLTTPDASVTTTGGTVTGTAIFSQFDLAGRLLAEAGVPSASAVPNQAIFVDTQGGFSIGVAYANAGTAAANVTFSLLNSSAASVATTTQLL